MSRITASQQVSSGNACWQCVLAVVWSAVVEAVGELDRGHNGNGRLCRAGCGGDGGIYAVRLTVGEARAAARGEAAISALMETTDSRLLDLGVMLRAGVEGQRCNVGVATGGDNLSREQRSSEQSASPHSLALSSKVRYAV